MPTIPAKNKCKPFVLAAIQVAVPGFIHSCTHSDHKAEIVCGSLIDDYCIAVNGKTTNLLPSGMYQICNRMKYHVIKRKLKKNSSVRTTKIDSNNNTTTEEVHADSNN